MKKKSLSLSYFVYAAFFLAAALTFVQLFLYLQYYDFEKSLWMLGTPLLIKGLPYILLVLTALFAVAFSVTAKHGEDCDLTGDTRPVTLLERCACSVIMAALLATLIAQLVSVGSFDHLNLLFDPASKEFVAIAAFFHGLTLLLAIPAGLYFFSLLRGKKPSILMGIITVFYLLALTLRVYFDMNQLLNDPRWTFRILALSLLLVFLLLDVHLLISKKILFFFRVVAVIALAASTASALTSVILTFSNHLSLGAETAYFVVELAFAFYIAVRLLTLSKDIPVGESPLPTETEPSGSEETPVEEAPVEEAPVEEAPVEESTSPVESEQASEASPVDEESESEEASEEALPDLTKEEVKLLYKAILLLLIKNKGITNPTEEEKVSLQEEAGAIFRQVLEIEDRNARITAARAFLAKSGL